MDDKKTERGVARWSVALYMTLWIAGAAAAEEPAPQYVELEERYTTWHVEYYVRDDLSVDRITTFEARALTDAAAKSLQRHRFSYSTSIEQSEVLEAYTVKGETGERIPVPEDNYQVTVNQGNRDGGPVFSDRTRVAVVFPDFEVGDSVHAKIRNTETEPMFPGHFSASQYYYSETAYDDVRVTINMPESLDVQYQVRGMRETSSVEDGRRILELTYSNPRPLQSERDDFSVWNPEDESGFAISTFKDYESISSAYGERAAPKAVPTDRVKKLAAEIVGGEEDSEAQARLLYDWVATNISYAGNCIGVGAVVPRDTDFILDNRMGDCKDHATLLEALYTSVGIESTQALINSGSVYSLPRIPMVSSVNHVINYLPQWDRFVDATNSSMPFDLLDFSVSDKPVLLVEGFREGQRTPAMQPGDARQEMHAVMRIQPDGSVKGTMDVALTGQPAASMRQLWRDINAQQEQEWIEAMFSSQSHIGSGAITREDPKPLLDSFKYAYEFDRPEYIASEGAGGFYAFAPGYSPFPVASLLQSMNEDVVGYDVACGSGISTEELVIEFPDNVKVLATPNDLSIQENFISYRATYKLEGQRLSIRREVNDSTPGNVCKPELMNAQRETIARVSKNLLSQVVYQYQ